MVFAILARSKYSRVPRKVTSSAYASCRRCRCYLAEQDSRWPKASMVSVVNSLGIKKPAATLSWTSERAFSAILVEEEPTNQHIPFLLADIGEGIREVELLEWCVSPGQSVRQFEKVCVVQSDKATVEITSRYDGTITELSGGVGDMILVGEPLLYMHSDDASGVLHLPTKAPETDPNENHSSFDPDNQRQSNEDENFTVESNISRPSKLDSAKLPTSPAVRKLAIEHDVDLSTVDATGPKGRILKKDILRHIDGGYLKSQRGDETPDNSDGSKIVTLKGMSRLMVKSMTESLTVPQMGLGDDINLDSLLSYKRQLSEASSASKISLLAFLVKACSLALLDYPLLNSRIQGNIEEDYEVKLLGHHDIGIAMDTNRGLVVPVIQKVESLSIQDIQNEIDRLKDAANNSGISSNDLAQPSFTLSNIGSLGAGTSLQPVLGPPLVAMGAIGRIQSLPRFDESGTVVSMSVMHVSWAADHRVLDGATLARFHTTFAEYVADPVLMITRLT